MTPKVRIGCRYERPYFVERTTMSFRALRPALSGFEYRLQESLLQRAPSGIVDRIKEMFRAVS